MSKPKLARERATRALCELHGEPPSAKMDGEPIWMPYLPEVDAVLQAALSKEDWRRLTAVEKEESS